jgi:hypothetical protein
MIDPKINLPTLSYATPPVWFKSQDRPLWLRATLWIGVALLGVFLFMVVLTYYLTIAQVP